MSYEQERKVALEAVCTAARICQSVQQSISSDVLQKKDKSPVTIADFASQAVICKALKQAFPEDPIIAEEDSRELREPENEPFMDRILQELARIDHPGDSQSVCDWIDAGHTSEYSDRFWTLDPIDGTKGFLRGEQYAISLALIIAGEITLSAVGCPNLPLDWNHPQQTGALLCAIRGNGANIRSLANLSDSSPVKVSTEEKLSALRFCESVESGHSSHSHSAQVFERLEITAEPVRLDSQAKYAVVAQGAAEVYLRLPTRPGYIEKIWDHAGGVLLVEEAGGRVTDILGKPLEFTHGKGLEQNRGVVVSHGVHHETLIETLHNLGIE